MAERTGEFLRRLDPATRPTAREHQEWRTERLVASVWWCGDEVCDCSQPLIERITPNVRAGWPWILRETVWEGEFLTDTFGYSHDQREELQYAPLREACKRFGVPVPTKAAADPVVDLTEGETRPRLATSKFPPRQPGRDTVAADVCPVCGGENEGNWSRCREHAVDLTGDGND